MVGIFVSGWSSEGSGLVEVGVTLAFLVLGDGQGRLGGVFGVRGAG